MRICLGGKGHNPALAKKGCGYTTLALVMADQGSRSLLAAFVVLFVLVCEPVEGSGLFSKEPGFRVMVTKKGLDYGTVYFLVSRRRTRP